MSGCCAIGSGIDECDADVYDMADVHNRQVIRLIDILGQTGGKKSKRMFWLACPRSISQRGLSFWTIAWVIFRFVLGASTALKVAGASLGTAACMG